MLHRRGLFIESLEPRTLLSAALLGDAFDYALGGFHDAGLNLNGGAAISSQSYTNQLQLTDGGANESASAFTQQTFGVSALSTNFSFQFTTPANSGIALVIQGQGSSATGSGPDGSFGISSSVALSFDLSSGSSQTFLTINGVSSAPTALDASGIQFTSGDVINVTVEYDGNTLQVSETDATTLATASQQYGNVNIPAMTGNNAFVGFTAADGATGDTQDILNWEFADNAPTPSNIGSATGPGNSYTYQVGGQYNVIGAGTGLGGTTDQLAFLSQPITGDSTLVAQITLPAAGSTAGIMLGDSAAPNSPFAWVGLTSAGAQFASRAAIGASTASSSVTAISGSTEYLELVSDGPTVSGYMSATGTPGTWALVGTTPVTPLSNNSLSGALIGLAVSSGDPSNDATASFANVSLTATAPVGVDTGDAGRSNAEDDQLWVNVIKEAGGFFVPSTNTPVSVDSVGWPTADFAIPGIMQEYSDSLGVYTLSMQVAQNPTIKVGGGTLSNQVYNAATQTVTASITAKGGTLGITVTNTSGGARNIQVLRPGYSLNNTSVFTTNYLDFLQSLHPGILRFMNWTNTNDNGVQTWSQRALPSDPMQTESAPVLNFDGTVSTFGNQPKGTAWEYAIMLANAVHADMWINIPAEANDNYVQQLANLIKNGDTVNGVTYPALSPDLNVYIEYSNEVWNPGFAANSYATGAAVSEVVNGAHNGTPSNLNFDNLPLTQNIIGSPTVIAGTYVNGATWESRWVARRLMQISNIFGSVFGQSAINTRIRAVMSNLPAPSVQAGQLAYINSVFGAPGKFFYSIATATYANMNGPANTPNTLNGGNNNPNLSINGVLDDLSANSYALTSLYDSMSSLASSYGLQLEGYESGPDLSGFQGTGAAGIKVKTETSPLFSNFLEQYYQDWFAHGGGAIIYYGGYARAWGQKYGDFQISDAVLDLNNAKEIGLRNVVGSPRPQVVARVPTGLKAVAASDTQINLTWTGGAGATEFRIEASTSSAFNANLSTQIAPAGSTSWAFTGLAPGEPYYFRVVATTTAGDSNPSNTASASTTGALTTPAAPANLAATPVNNSTVNLQWLDNSQNETSFVITVATDPGFTQNLQTLTAPADATQLLVEDLNALITYYFQIIADNASGPSSSPLPASATTPAAVPLAQYPLNELSGSTVSDTSGFGSPANGSIVGGVTRVPGPAGGSALSFDGSTGYINVGTPSKLNIQGQITVSAWIKTTSVSSQGDIVDQDWDSLDTPFYLAVINSTTVDFGTYRFIFNGNSAVDAIGHTASPLTDGQWHFVAGVYDGTRMKVYVDGQLLGAASDPYGVTTGTMPTEIGRDAHAGGGSFNYFNGAIADVSIYNAGLSDADVASLAGQSVINLPIAGANGYSTTANVPLTKSAPQGVLANDFDPNGLPMTATLYSNTVDGSLVLNSDGSFTYTPAFSFVGIDSFAYQATDALGSSQPVKVTITVNPPAVTNFQAGPVIGNQTTLTWSDSFPASSGFILQESTDSADWATIATLPSTANSFPVSSLTSSHFYDFRIAAVSGTLGSQYVGTPTLFVTQAIPAPIIQTSNSSTTTRVGTWWGGSFIPGFYGTSFLNDGNQAKGSKSVTFNFNLTTAGNYDVTTWYPAAAGNAGNVPVEIVSAGGTTTETINEQQNGGQWLDLGIFAFNTGPAQVIFLNAGTKGLVVANAVQLKYTAAAAPTLPPANFTGIAASQTSITLNWTESVPVTGFVLQQSSDGNSWNTIANPLATDTSYPVKGLTPGGTYYFRIQAVGSGGSSLFVQIGPIKTPTPVTVIRTTASTSTVLTGRWWGGSFIPGYYGTSFLNDGNQGKGTKSVTFNVPLPTAGSYQVYTWYPAAAGNAANVPVSIVSASGTSLVTVNEQQSGGQWVLLGTFSFNTTGAQVVFSNAGTTGLVVANAVEFVQVG